MKMEYCSLVDTQVHQQYAPSHHESFSSSSSMGSCEYEGATGSAPGSYSGLPLVDQLETPPPSATMSNFFGLEMQQSSMVPATVAPHMTSAYNMGNMNLSSSAYSQPPATRDRHSSISSHHSSPMTPANMIPSYASSVTTPDSTSSHSQTLLCESPEAYFDMRPQQGSAQQHQQHQAQHQGHQQAHQQTHQQTHHHQHQAPQQQQQQAPPQQQQQQHHHHQHPHAAYGHPYNVMATPSPVHSMRECNHSPTDFVYNNRTDSPIRDYFGDRSVNPPPPPSTLPSSVVRYGSPEDAAANMARRYSTASSASSYASNPMMQRQYSRMGDVRRHSEALQRISTTRNYDYSPYGNNGSCGSPTGGGHLVVRNGIRVSRVASGAFKCIIPGCPSRPFKRSEHLKRHVTTHHENKDTFPCEFCGRSFNRKDNWRSHLKLHTVSRGKNARTDYYQKAVTVYTEEMRKVSKCRPRKEKQLHDE